MRKLTLFLMLVVVLGVTAQVVSADSRGGQQVAIILADGQAIRDADGGQDLVSSFAGLVATLRSKQPVAFMTVDDPYTIVGPVMVDGPEFNALQEEISARLISAGPARDSGLFYALVEAYNLLGIETAAPGSAVYLVTGGDLDEDPASLADRLVPLVGQFGDSAWPVYGVSLPGTSDEVTGVLEGVAAGSGGAVFELSIPDGFRGLADAILKGGAQGSLDELSGGVLTPSELLTSDLSVAPGTRETTLIFFREAPFGSLRLSNPSGFEASTGDRTASYVIETPHVVVWRLVDPVPGKWQVDARRIDGLISAWHYSSNKYRLVLESSAPFPINEPTTLVAYASEDQQPVPLEGAQFFANVTTPRGATLVYTLNDMGVQGDAAGGDGYFSVSIPRLRMEGDYRVELELFWPDYDLRISSQSGFRAQSFPAIELRAVRLGDFRPGERAKVAEAFIHVQGEPFAVSADQITAELAAAGDQAALLELVPQRLFGDGSTWLYDVYFTASEARFQTLTFRLTLEYAGRRHIHTSESIVLTSVAPLSPEPVVESPVVEDAVVAPAAPQVVEAPVQPEPSGFPWWTLAFPLAAIAVIGVAALFWYTRPPPRGYLYNDRDELLVDFARLRRHPLLSLLFRSSIAGKELKVPGLEAISFHFSARRIGIRGKDRGPGVRVNNQPLLDKAWIHDQTWIGTGGKLFSFLLSPLRTGAAPGAADD